MNSESSSLETTIKLCNGYMYTILYIKNIGTSPIHFQLLSWLFCRIHCFQLSPKIQMHLVFSNRKMSTGFISRNCKRVVLTLGKQQNRSTMTGRSLLNKILNNYQQQWTTFECTGTLPDSELKCPRTEVYNSITGYNTSSSLPSRAHWFIYHEFFSWNIHNSLHKKIQEVAHILKWKY